jgi:hypothetical protein
MSGLYDGELRDMSTDPKVEDIRGFVKDEWGWIITLKAVAQPDGSYKLKGILGEPPDCLRVPAIDGARV